MNGLGGITLELRVLRYFLTVAREGSISRAAHVLHLTQPTLSRQLMELEERLGTKLFIRGNRKMTLTDEGLLLRKRAQEIIDLVQKTEGELQTSDEIIGDIYMGCGETYGMSIVAKIIKELQNTYPGIRYHLFSGNADEVTDRLDKSLIDFGILIEPIQSTNYDSIYLPDVDTWGLLMRKDSPLASRTTIRPEDLWEIPLISSNQTLVSHEISKWLKKDYEKLNWVATYNLIYNASLMVEQGIGYALCLDRLVNTSSDSPLCFKPLEPPLEAEIAIVWKKHQLFSKPATLFYQRIHETLANAKL